MKKILLSIIIFLLSQIPLWAEPSIPRDTDKITALAVQTFKVQPYEDAVAGFENTFPGRTQNLCLCDISTQDILSKISQQKPDLILSVGVNALTGMLPVKEIPIIYLMVLDPPAEALNAGNIFGISMMVQPEDQLSILQKTMPWIKKIGIIYDSEASGAFVQVAREFAQKWNIVLVDRKIMESREFIDDLNAIRDEIDVFWMLPDVRLLTSENIEYLLLMSVENKIPIITFSEKFVELGAFMAIGVDAKDMGAQAGQLASRILEKPGHAVDKIVYPEKARVTINGKILKKLNIPFRSNEVNHLNIIK